MHATVCTQSLDCDLEAGGRKLALAVEEGFGREAFQLLEEEAGC